MNSSIVWFGLFVVAAFWAARYRALWQSAEKSREFLTSGWNGALDRERETQRKYDALERSWRRWREETDSQIKRLQTETDRAAAVLDSHRAAWHAQREELRRELIETQDYAIRAGRAALTTTTEK